ncbi:hypothetical protein D3C87_125920 [compost metagenome]
MKILAQIVLFFVLSFNLADAKSMNCDAGLAEKTKVIDGHPMTYELKVSGFNFGLGGPTEDFLGSIDKEAVKRTMIYCSPGISDCLKASKLQKTSGDILISFELNPGKEASQAVKFKISSAPANSPELNKCIENVLVSARYPNLPSGIDVVEVKVPLRFR